jgi:invasion protein IalB
MKHFITLVAVVLASVWAIAPAMAGQAKASDDKVFGDWILHCAKTSAGEEACALHQTKLPVAAFAIARSKDSQELRLAAILPLGLDIPAGVSGKAGDLLLAFQVQTCVRRGCIASTQVHGKLLETLHGAREFTATFKMRSVADPTTLAVSLNGLDEALKALESK